MSSPLASAYHALGLTPSATEIEIKKAYKKLCLKYHPDRNLDKAKWAADKFCECQEAYEALTDPEAGRKYARKHRKPKANGDQQAPTKAQPRAAPPREQEYPASKPCPEPKKVSTPPQPQPQPKEREACEPDTRPSKPGDAPRPQVKEHQTPMPHAQPAKVNKKPPPRPAVPPQPAQKATYRQQGDEPRPHVKEKGHAKVQPQQSERAKDHRPSPQDRRPVKPAVEQQAPAISRPRPPPCQGPTDQPKQEHGPRPIDDAQHKKPVKANEPQRPKEDHHKELHRPRDPHKPVEQQHSIVRGNHREQCRPVDHRQRQTILEHAKEPEQSRLHEQQERRQQQLMMQQRQMRR